VIVTAGGAVPRATMDGVACTAIAGHTVRYVEADIGSSTLIAAVGVPAMLVLGQVKAVLALVKVHALMSWPVLRAIT